MCGGFFCFCFVVFCFFFWLKQRDSKILNKSVCCLLLCTFLSLSRKRTQWESITSLSVSGAGLICMIEALNCCGGIREAPSPQSFVFCGRRQVGFTNRFWFTAKGDKRESLQVQTNVTGLKQWTKKRPEKVYTYVCVWSEFWHSSLFAFPAWNIFSLRKKPQFFRLS